MSMLIGIKNFLYFVNENWTIILCIIGLAVGIYRKFSAWLSTSTQDKINIAKKQISESILKMITDAEVDYSDWAAAGQIKRSQVIAQIYTEYPILEKVTSQDELLEWIDAQIDSALGTLKDVITKNENSVQIDT